MDGNTKIPAKDRIRQYEGYGSLVSFSCKIVLLIFAFSIFSPVFCGVSPLLGIRFFLFQIFFILIPGFALALLLRIPASTNVQWFGTSWFLGYAADFLLYFPVLPVHGSSLTGKAFFPVLPAVLFLAACLVLIRKRKDVFVCERDRGGEWICLIFILASLLFEFVIYSGNNMIPILVSDDDYNRDLLYWIGNTVELTKEFPPRNFRNYPMRYNYHYFSSLQLALMSMITGIRPVITGFVFHYIQSILLYVFGAYLLFAELVRKKTAAAFLTGILLFSTGLEEMSGIIYTWHLYFDPYGYDYGFGFFLWMLLFALMFYRKKEFDPKTAFFLPVCIAIQTGLKGPCGVAALLLYGLLCFFKLFRKEAGNALLTGIPVLIAFALTYFLIVNVTGYSNNESSMDYMQTITSETFDNNALQGTPAVEKYMTILNAHVPFPVKLPFLFVCVNLYSVLVNPVIALLYFAGIFEMFRRKQADAFGVSLMIVPWVMNVLTMQFHIFGASEMFFAMIGIPVQLALFAYVFGKQGLPETGILAAAAFVGITFFVFGSESSGVEHYLRTGVSALVRHASRPTYGWENGYDYMSSREWEIYEKLRDMPGEKLITNTNTYIVGCVTEKYAIRDEGLKEIFRTMDPGKQTSCLEELRKEGIGYVIVNREAADPEYRIVSDRANLIFDEDELSVYEVKP